MLRVRAPSVTHSSFLTFIRGYEVAQMVIYWIAKSITFFPVSIKNASQEPVGELRSITELAYLNEQYLFEYKIKPTSTTLFAPNEINVLNRQGNKLALITDPQWLRPIKIDLSDGNGFTMHNKLSFRTNFVIKNKDKKLGEFNEQYFALSPRGNIKIDETHSKNKLLIASILYVGLFKRMLSI